MTSLVVTRITNQRVPDFKFGILFPGEHVSYGLVKSSAYLYIVHSVEHKTRPLMSAIKTAIIQSRGHLFRSL